MNRREAPHVATRIDLMKQPFPVITAPGAKFENCKWIERIGSAKICGKQALVSRYAANTALLLYREHERQTHKQEEVEAMPSIIGG